MNKQTADRLRFLTELKYSRTEALLIILIEFFENKKLKGGNKK